MVTVVATVVVDDAVVGDVLVVGEVEVAKVVAASGSVPHTAKTSITVRPIISRLI